MRFLHLGERHYINIDTILSINCSIPHFIQIDVNGNIVYDLQYTEKHFDEFCNKLIEKIVDETVKIVDMHDIKKEVEHL